jgi:hypothetical protein
VRCHARHQHADTGSARSADPAEANGCAGRAAVGVPLPARGPRFEAGAAWGVRVGAGCGGGVERELERLRRERRLARSLSLAQLVEVLCRSR